jgi:hypothetical protein
MLKMRCTIHSFKISETMESFWMGHKSHCM